MKKSVLCVAVGAIGMLTYSAASASDLDQLITAMKEAEQNEAAAAQTIDNLHNDCLTLVEDYSASYKELAQLSQFSDTYISALDDVQAEITELSNGSASGATLDPTYRKGAPLAEIPASVSCFPNILDVEAGYPLRLATSADITLEALDLHIANQLLIRAEIHAARIDHRRNIAENAAESLEQLNEWIEKETQRFDLIENVFTANSTILDGLRASQQSSTEVTFDPLIDEKPTHAPENVAIASLLPRGEQNGIQDVKAVTVALQQPDFSSQKRLVTSYPFDTDVWTNLAMAFFESNLPSESYATLLLAYLGGIDLPDTDTLISYAIRHENWYTAGRLLESELGTASTQSDDIRLQQLHKLAGIWNVAREENRAITTLREASDLDKEGRSAFVLGERLISAEQFAEAESVLREAIEKGIGDDTAQAWILVGISIMNQDIDPDVAQLKRAREAFKNATSSIDPYGSSQRAAEDYIYYIDELIAAIELTEEYEAQR